MPPHVRNACDFIAQIMAMMIGARTRSAETAERMMRHRIETHLLARMAAEARFIDGLSRNPDDTLALVDANGAAVIIEGTCTLLGNTPTESQVLRLAEWLEARDHHEIPFHTENLPGVFPEAEAYSSVASGLLAMSISQLHPSYVLWFRPEVVETVTWGGDPTKTMHGGRINPRKSFEDWREQVRGHSVPWTPAALETVRSLSNAITGIVLRKAEEMAALTEELRRSNRELEAFSYSVSHDLRAPFRHIVGYAELLKEETDTSNPLARRYLDTIIESAFSAGRLVDDLLNFS
ncbi:histidine kinase dimerization/phospho-acceptor domain-containing protein [Falsirhodobacter deserti]|uniref:histidine kinase dimerization/phospho-acceptor domain-containing protein n=1 Tax=Falsirhodobacter deserti TaxID=1365611 RepID=UPI0019D473A9|nr:histidine kinase dimerization/phospho-acceptor domain-containing protein [Falsirhodobacter deserti]